MNFIFVWDFRKMNICLDRKILWIFFFFWGGGDRHKTGLILGVNSMHVRVFLKVNIQNGDIFLGY